MNKKFILGIGLGALLALGACATPKMWSATGGSRSDGTVRLSYEFTLFEKPIVDEAGGLRLAAQRCAVWGYTGAEAFGGVTQTCNSSDGYGGCNGWIVTKEYQCTGTGTRSGTSYSPPHSVTLQMPLLSR